MKEERTGAKYIADFLKSYDVTHVFYVLAMLRETLAEMEKVGIKRITTHGEKAATYMADGYARISRRPGIAMAQSVGAANLAAGLQDAYLGHSPVIALSGRKPPQAQYRNAYQEIIHGSMYEAVTKYNVNVDKGEQLPILLRQAFREATSGAPRPVHMDILGYTGEIIEKEIISGPLEVEERYKSFPAVRIDPDNAEIEKALRFIKAASKPVVVAGSGAVSSDAGKEVLEFSNALSIPVAFSCNAKGLIPDTYWLNSGAVGSYSCACANRVVSEADLVIFIGSGVGDQVTMNWTIPQPDIQKIQIDINPSELGRSYPKTFGILGDAKTTVAKMLQMTNVMKLKKKTKWGEMAGEIIHEWKESRKTLREADSMPIRPERLCKEISDILPPNSIVVADTGYSAIWASTMIDLNSIEQRFIRAAGSLGWAFPASLGAKCAAPERPVFCFAGDGALWYHIAELETACRCGINTITVVNNNSAYGQSIEGVNKAYGNRSGNREEVYAFKKVNFAKIAEEIGCLGIRVEQAKDIKPALIKALSANIPVVIDVVTDRMSKPETPWRP